MSNNAHAVSVIINNFNYGRFLTEAINSALGQTYPNVEVIVVDDGSTDESKEVARAYGSRIKFIAKTNGGQASAINEGYKASSGEFVIFLDSDDFLASDICDKVVAEFEGNPGVAKVQFRLRVIDVSGLESGGLLPPQRIRMPQGDIRKLLIRQRSYAHPPTSGNAFRRAELDFLMPIPEDVYRKGAAAYLVYNAVIFGNIKSLDSVGGFYRMHGGNITATNPYLDGARLRAHIEEEVRERNKQIEIFSGIDNEKIPEIGLADLTHAKSRVILKKLFPDYYRYDDLLLSLCLRGFVASFLYRDIRMMDRLLWAGWFIAMLLVSNKIAKVLVEQAMDNKGRRLYLLKKLLGDRDRRA